MKAIAIGVCVFALSMFIAWMLGVDVLERSGPSGCSWMISIWLGGYTGSVFSGVPA